jgi:hypothetical protein
MVRYRQNPGSNQIIIDVESENEEEAGRLADFLSNRILAATQGPIRRALKTTEKYARVVTFLNAEIARCGDMLEGRKPTPGGLQDRKVLVDRYLSLLALADDMAVKVDSIRNANRDGRVIYRSVATRPLHQRLLLLLFPAVLAIAAAGSGVVVLAEIVSRSRRGRERLSGNAADSSS